MSFEMTFENKLKRTEKTGLRLSLRIKIVIKNGEIDVCN